MSLPSKSRTALTVVACTCTVLGVLPTAASASPATPTTPAGSTATHVIVLLHNQHANLPTRGSRRAERRQANAADQKPLLDRARRAGGKNLHSYTLVNGFSATVPASQVSQLAADPAVAAVVPDRLVHLPMVSRPDAAPGWPTRTAPRRRTARRCWSPPPSPA